jgi:hypothetical protein
MDDKWLCTRCHAWNTYRATRCSFCSNPKPGNSGETAEQQDQEAGNKLTQQLHNIIEKMTLSQKRKTLRWFEDNVI